MIDRITAWYHAQPASRKSMVLISAYFVIIYLFFTSQGLVLEWIFSSDDKGFTYGSFASLFELVAYAVFSACIEVGPTKVMERNAPMWTHGVVACALTLSRALTFMSLSLLTYPTVTLFKSCKLVVVMIAGLIWFRKRYSLLNYFSAIIIIAGASLFSLADASTLPTFDARGVLFVCLSLVADAVHVNMQERILRVYKASEGEMIFWSNSVGTLLMVVYLLCTGELFEAMAYCARHPTTLAMLVLSALLGYCGSKAWVRVIHQFGAITATLVGNSRKIFSLILSFVIFPKPVVYHYVVGTVLFFTGVFLNSYADNSEKRPTNANSNSGGNSGNHGQGSVLPLTRAEAGESSPTGPSTALRESEASSSVRVLLPHDGEAPRR